MNADLFPLAVAASGGGVVAAIATHEARRTGAMRDGRALLGLRFPLGLEVETATAALRHLSGMDWRQELVLELHAEERRITHRLYVPRAVRDSVARSFYAAMPGTRLTKAETPAGRAQLAVKLFLPTPLVLHDGDIEHGSRSLLTALTAVQADEEVVLRWALSSGRPRHWPATPAPRDHDQTALRLWRRKVAGAGLRVAGLLLVQAATPARARQLADAVLTAIRGRAGQVGRIRATYDGRGRSLASLPRVNRLSGWLSLGELLPLVGWPLGRELVPGLEVGGARELLVPHRVPRDGRVLLVGRDDRGERPVALSLEAAHHHLAVIGPTGVGKTALIGRGVLSDLRVGLGGVLLDPKADLVADLLRRIHPDDADRIVMLDPADGRQLPALDLFGVGDPDVRADVLLGVLTALFKSTSGIRTETWGRLGLRTLAEVPEATLADLGRLFADSGYRRAAVARLTDPFLRSQWEAFEHLSPAAQIEHVASPLSKVTALVSRPAIRSVLASPQPTIDLDQLWREGKWLFVNLAPSSIGEPAARLLGAALTYLVWSAIEARSALRPEERTPVSVVVDELATIADAPVSLELLLQRARGFRASVTLGLQNLSSLPDATRAALLGNVGSLITFRAPADESKRLAREFPGLTSDDLEALGPFEVAARVGVGVGSEVSFVTGRTLPWPGETGLSERIRDRSAERYGATPLERTTPQPNPPDEPGEPQIGRRPRRSV